METDNWALSAAWPPSPTISAVVVVDLPTTASKPATPPPRFWYSLFRVSLSRILLKVKTCGNFLSLGCWAASVGLVTDIISILPGLSEVPGKRREWEWPGAGAGGAHSICWMNLPYHSEHGCTQIMPIVITNAIEDSYNNRKVQSLLRAVRVWYSSVGSVSCLRNNGVKPASCRVASAWHLQEEWYQQSRMKCTQHSVLSQNLVLFLLAFRPGYRYSFFVVSTRLA